MKYPVLILALLTLAYGKLLIYNPSSLRKKFKPSGEIKSSLANFGHIPYGHNVIGRVWYDSENPDGCGEFKRNITGDGDPDASPSPIVLVHRGNCPFVKKVRNVEHAGGALAIIVDNKPGEMVDHVIMVDDGTGGGIKIPSMLIGTKDGKKLLTEVEKRDKSWEGDEDDRLSPVQLIARFEMPHPDNRVEYDFWYSSANQAAVDFLVEWEDSHNKFKKDVFFTPRFVSWSCENCDQDQKDRDCFNDGKYCAFHVDNPALKGQDVLYENLREKCLHDKLQKKGGDKQWWEYIRYVHTHCRVSITKTCSRDAMKEIGVDFDEIEDCVNDSFYDEDHSSAENRILSKEAEAWNSNGPSFFPALIVNNITYRGFLTPDNVFEAICQGFEKHPSECKGATGGNSHIFNGISTETMVFIVVGILVCNLVLLVLYRRYYKNEMQNEVKMAAHSAVSQYFAIQNNDRESAQLKTPGI